MNGLPRSPHVTLLGALVIAAPASAAEWDMRFGGYLEQNIAYVSYDSDTASDFDGLDGVGGARFYFAPAFTLDGGLRFGSDITLEGFYGETNSGLEFEQAALYVDGAFGRIDLGKLDTPGNDLHQGFTQDFGLRLGQNGLSDSALASFVPFSGVHNNRRVGDDVRRGTLGSTRIANTGEETHGRIRYFTPDLGGFRAAASFAHESPGDHPDRRNFLDLGASYQRAFGDVDMGASLSWGRAENRVDPTADPTYLGAGAHVRYRGFTLGGSWAESSDSSSGITDGRAYEIGLAYERGATTLSLGFLSGENIDNENLGLGAKERLDALTFGVNYAVFGRPAPRATDARFGDRPAQREAFAGEVYGFVSYAAFDEDTGDGGAGTPGDDVEGIVIGTGFRLSF